MAERLPERGKKYYLAGPMTGYAKYNFPAFDLACQLLREKLGLTILSPHEIDHGETEQNRGSLHYSVYMRAGLKLLLECEGIIMLPRWEDSDGAQLEFKVAAALSMPAFSIMTLEEKWWGDDKYAPVLFMDERATRFIRSFT